MDLPSKVDLMASVALPEVGVQHIPLPTVGLTIPPSSVSWEELRETLAPAVVDALEKLSAQVRRQIFDPLVYAEDREHLAKTFERVYPGFWNHYLGIVLTLWAAVGDPQRFSVLTVRVFERSQDLLRQRGPQRIGQDATAAALLGLHTVARVSRAAMRLLEPGASSALPASESLQVWASWVVAYAMAACTVWFALSAERLHGRPENAVQLAYWSKGYALRVYDLSQRLGLLRYVPASGPLPATSDDEDVPLANAGLDEYRQLLAREDEA